MAVHGQVEVGRHPCRLPGDLGEESAQSFGVAQALDGVGRRLKALAGRRTRRTPRSQPSGRPPAHRRYTGRRRTALRHPTPASHAHPGNPRPNGSTSPNSRSLRSLTRPVTNPIIWSRSVQADHLPIGHRSSPVQHRTERGAELRHGAHTVCRRRDFQQADQTRRTGTASPPITLHIEMAYAVSERHPTSSVRRGHPLRRSPDGPRRTPSYRWSPRPPSRRHRSPTAHGQPQSTPGVRPAPRRPTRPPSLRDHEHVVAGRDSSAGIAADHRRPGAGGLPPWRRPWASPAVSGLPANFVSRQSYRGTNPLTLTLSAMEQGWPERWWGTFNQWKELGCSVRPRPAHVPPGRWGTRVVYCKPVERTRQTDDGEQEDRFWVLKEYCVFHVRQVEGAAAERLLARPGCGATRVADYAPAERAMARPGCRSGTAGTGRPTCRPWTPSSSRPGRPSPPRPTTTARRSTNSPTPPATRPSTPPAGQEQHGSGTEKLRIRGTGRRNLRGVRVRRTRGAGHRATCPTPPPTWRPGCGCCGTTRSPFSKPALRRRRRPTTCWPGRSRPGDAELVLAA